MDSTSSNSENTIKEKSSKSYAWILTHILPVSIFALLLVLSEYYPDLTILDSAFCFIMPSIILCYFDKQSLDEQSAGKLKNWYVYIPTLYLWKRYQILNNDKDYALEWTIAVVFFTGFILFKGYSANILSNTACETVTEIMYEQLSINTACKRVDIDEEVSKGFYLATAILENGKKIDIAITEHDDGQINVEIVDGIFSFIDTDMFYEPKEPVKVWKPSKPVLGGDTLWGNKVETEEIVGDDFDDGVIESMGHDYNDPYYTDRATDSELSYDQIRNLPDDLRYDPTTGESLYPEVHGPESRLSQYEIDELNRSNAY